MPGLCYTHEFFIMGNNLSAQYAPFVRPSSRKIVPTDIGHKVLCPMSYGLMPYVSCSICTRVTWVRTQLHRSRC